MTNSHDTAACDVLVIGSGAGGLSAAVTARWHHLDVLVVEKELCLGGTTAVSGGWIWIPGNHVARRVGIGDSLEAARRYLEHEAGACFDRDRVDAFLEGGPRMVEFFERETAVRFMPSVTFPDYHPDAPGAARGRSILAEPFDARELGDDLAKLRRPLQETTLFGLNIGSGTELAHFFKASRSVVSAAYVARRMMGHAVDLARYGRGMRLSNGNALAARLAKSAFALGVQFMLSSPVTGLDIQGGVVRGAVVRTPQGETRITARRGVVLACGGFSHDTARQKLMFPHVRSGTEHASPVPAGITGDGLDLGESAGGTVDTTLHNSAAWVPVSVVPHRDGTQGVFPHVIDRAKPGVIAVTRDGVRFVNEACPYHDFVQAMFAVNRGDRDVHAFVLCDHRTIRRYGLGYAKPFPLPLGSLLKAGYLLRGDSIADLARRAAIDGEALEATVATFNTDARQGRDPRFGKGSNAYNQFQGDQGHKPNPCLAPIEQPPFYAVRIRPGDLSTFAGLRADRFGRVLDAANRAIQGLYVAGNDMSSVAGGSYPGAGINLGLAMTFGYLAGLHAAGELPERAVPAMAR